MTEQDKEAMKRVAQEILLDDPPSSVNGFFTRLMSTCKSKDIKLDGAFVIEYWWNLARIGVVAVPGVSLNDGFVSHGQRLPTLVVTERGKRLLKEGEQSPHDPPKYLSAVRQRVESADEIVMTYLDEAVGAWFAGLHRASAVMLGCACERLVLMLAEQIARANVPPWSAKIEKKLKDTLVSISSVFDVVRDCLTQLSNEKKLPGALGDAIDRKLSAIFDHARGLRNKSGHPTGADVTSEDAEASLKFFPGFYALVSDLCKCLVPDNAGKASA